MTATLGTLAMWGASGALLVAGALALADHRAAPAVNRAGVLLAGAAVACLAWALATGDLTLAYVAATTDRATSWPYRLAGLWGGMGGSLLLWSTMVAAWGWRRTITGGERVALAWLGAGFLVIAIAFASPWSRLSAPALDGLGATPILRHPAMLYHPPILYLGLTGLVVPWAATVAAGFTGGFDRSWATRVRRQLLACLGVLTLGMVAGAHWAYVELGWGGFWAWDPVENTALLPWLAVIGALHGLNGWRRHGRGRFAAAGLTSTALAVAVLGTMLTRSGAAPSVHAFGEDGAVGWALVVVTVAVAAASTVAMVTAGRGGLEPPPGASPAPGDGPSAARMPAEAWALRLQPWLAGFALLVVLLGTVRPLVGEADVAVDGSYYATILAPVAIVTVALMLRFRPGHLAHIGVVLLAIGVLGSTRAASTAVTLEPGASTEVNGWTVVNRGVEVVGDDTVRATVELRRAGDHVATLHPRVVAFPERGVELAETSLRATPLTDVQVVLRHADDDGRALLEVHVRPLVWFVWWGGLLLAGAALVAAVRAERPSFFGSSGAPGAAQLPKNGGILSARRRGQPRSGTTAPPVPTGPAR